VVPILLLLRAETPAQIAAAAPLYLFGFTYLWVGINGFTGWEARGLGWFSLFVALAAVGFSWHSLVIVGDPTFAVIWLYWAMLWGLFFVVLGLERVELTAFTGWVTVVQGFVTAAIPAFLILVERWNPGDAIAIGLIALALVVFGGLWSARDRLSVRPLPEAG
jgi:hypothetical protein